MLFSVIIPNYNRRNLLPEALDSVFRQVFFDYEVICVDDGSTDGSLDYLKTLPQPMTILSGPNCGPGGARNIGAKSAQGQYLAFLDSDDIWFPWTLKVFATLIDQYNSPAILSGCIQSFGDRGELPLKEGSLRSVYYADYLVGGAAGHIVGSGVAVIRRDLFLRTGGFTTRRINAEDHDLILRMGIERGFVQVLSPATMGWRQHPDSATKNLRKTFEGVAHLIKQEHICAYPGGVSRAFERQSVITRHARPAALEFLRRGMRFEAWNLYRSTLSWHVSGGRWKFLFGFPAKAFANVVVRSARPSTEALLLRKIRGAASRIRIMLYRMIGTQSGQAQPDGTRTVPQTGSDLHR